MAGWVYLSLGDSLSTDDYTGMDGGGAASLLFQNLPGMWPDFDGKDISSTFPDAEHVQLCTNGANLDDIISGQLPDVPKGGVNLVTFTGGTLQLFKSLGRFAPGFVEKDLLAAVAENATERHARVVNYVRERLPDAVFLICNLFNPTDGKGKAKDWIEWPGLNKFVKGVNTAIAECAAANNAELIDVHAAFKGHGMTVAPEKRWVGTLVELNARGAHEIRRLWWERLQKLGVV